jgi:MFS family permease
MQNNTAPARHAGAWQAIGLILALQIPITPIMSLAPNLPLLFRHFAAVPHRELLVPLIMTIPSIGIVLLGPLFGALADRLGRRRLLLGALALFGTAGLLPVFLESIYAILASQVAVGAGSAVIMTTANALIGDMFVPEDRNKWLGFQSIIGPFMSAAVAIGAGILGTISWHGPFATNAVALLAFAWILLTTWEPVRPAASRAVKDAGRAAPAAPAFPWGAILPVLAVTLLTGLIFYTPTVHMGIMYDQLGAHSSALIGLLTTTATVGSLLGGYHFKRQRFSVAGNLALLYLCFGAGMAGMGLSNSYLMGLAFAILINVGIGLTLPCLIAWNLNSLPPNHRGSGMGLWMSAFFLTQLICPPLFSLLMHSPEQVGPAFIKVGCVCLLLAAGTFVVARLRSAPAAA